MRNLHRFARYEAAITWELNNAAVAVAVVHNYYLTEKTDVD